MQNSTLTEHAAGEDFKKHFDVLFHASPVALAIRRMKDDVLIDVNPRMEQLIGYSRHELIGRVTLDLDMFPVPEQRTQIREQVAKAEHVREAEVDIRAKTGEIKHVIMSVTTLSFSGAPCALASFWDVTAERRAADALKRTQALLNKSQEIAKLGSWELDLKTQALWWSDEIYRMFDVNPLLFGASYEAFLNAIHPDDRDLVNLTFTQSVAERKPYSIIHRLLMKDGSVKYVHEQGGTVYDNEGNPLRSMGVVQDITERYLVDEQVKASLAEKEVLLKEIHHRVKNNLQVISSLLYLQARKLEDEGLRAVFRESQNRIISMSLIHEKLYQSKDLAHIPFKDYAYDLAISLFASHGTSLDRVQLNIQGNGFSLDVNDAVPYGLIITEIVSNSLKYGFPNGTKGAISIELIRSEDDVKTMIVSDNGVGLPADLADRTHTSLGLQLIGRLADQIGARLGRESSSVGTRYTIILSRKSTEVR